MKRLNLCLVIAWLFAGYSAIAAVADRFDYPIGNRDRYTEANDGDGWYSAQEFGDWSDGFLNYHLGEDWNAETLGNTDCGAPVFAVANGTIVYASIVTGWGRMLIVRHTLPDGSEVESLYGHLGSFAKTNGEVARGEHVGTIGNGSEGGSAYSCHLHFEIRTAGCPRWGVPGAGGSATPKPAGWTDPSDFIDSHRQVPIQLASGLANPWYMLQDGGYLYFIDNVASGIGVVKRVPKVGGPAVTIVSGAVLEGRGVNSLAVTQDSLFGHYGGYGANSVFQAPKSGGTFRDIAPGLFLAVAGADLYRFIPFSDIYGGRLDQGANILELSGVWCRSSAFDADAIYFSDYWTKDVKRFDLAARSMRTLIGSNPVEGGGFINDAFLFYNINGAIKQVPKAGGAVVTLVSTGAANGYVADNANVYFVDGNGLQSVPVGGGKTRVLQPFPGSVSSVAVDSDYLFWAENGGGEGVGRIFRIPKPGAVPSNLGTISLNTIGDWNYYAFGGFEGVAGVYYTNAVSGLFETAPGGIQFKADRYRGSHSIVTKGAFLLSGSVIECTWSGTGGSSFMQSQFGPSTKLQWTDAGNERAMCVNASYGNTFAGSWLAAPNRRYKTVVVVSDNSFDSTTRDIQTGAVMEHIPGTFDFTVPRRLMFGSGEAYDNQNAFLLLHDLQITTPVSGLRITQQPLSQTTIAGSNVSLSVAATSILPISYQWRLDGKILVGATNATLPVADAQASDSGGYSAIVWNAYGSVVSATAHLAVLADGANRQQPLPTADGPVLPETPGKDSVVIITHGWQPIRSLSSGPPAALPEWMTKMRDSIRLRLPSNWELQTYDWLPDAWQLTPELARDAAIKKGKSLGEQLAGRHYAHVHLIAHSAGAALIDSAARALREHWPATEIHCTFLDPFTGSMLQGRLTYGEKADWSENYFVQDFKTDVLPIALQYPPGSTEGPLTYAYNANVEGADPAAQFLQTFWSDPNANANSTPAMVLGRAPSPEHDSPCWFYLRSVDGTGPACAANYGYALSKEGGGWAGHASRQMGLGPVGLCNSVTHVPAPLPNLMGAPKGLDAGVFATSPQGIFGLSGNGLGLQSTPLPQAPSPGPSFGQGDPVAGVPAWYAMAVTITNAANIVTFEAAFVSTNAGQGLLTAFWNTNRLAALEEQVVGAGLQSYVYPLPALLTEGTYTLSFRLDSFGGVSSSVLVTNVAIGYRGLTNSFSLRTVGAATNATPWMELQGPAGYNYLVETSTNLVNWSAAALLVNTNGAVRFTDPSATNSIQRFYRALLP